MWTKFVFNIAQLLRKSGVKFDTNQSPVILEMLKNIQELGSIQFKIEIHPDGSWSAESVNVDGIITGGDNVKEINATLKDAIFTYYRIPPHICDDTLLKADNEPASVIQRVFATK